MAEPSPSNLEPVNDPLQNPPFIPIPGLSNFRDIGGYPVTPSLSVRKGILYRGPDLAPITSAGEQKLKELGIEVIFDLRSVPQIERAGGVKEVEGIKRVWCPVFEEGEYTAEKAGLRYSQYASEGTEVCSSILCSRFRFNKEEADNVAQGIVGAFLEILTHGAQPAFHTILSHLAQLQLKPCMIHCTTGNNRSGVFIFVLLSLLGAPVDTIADEYALSELGLRAGRDKVVERLLKNPKFKAVMGDGPEGVRRAQRMVGARRESMVALWESVQEKWGGVEEYVRGVVGLGEEEISALRDTMIEIDGGKVDGGN
ncbi:protein-tyrosine phosphatase-like protein [Tricladium varicosporioides]|nr:protein-tyrosine phosphatase-like protein [Hymenoscyphus varicosporioides]